MVSRSALLLIFLSITSIVLLKITPSVLAGSYNIEFDTSFISGDNVSRDFYIVVDGSTTAHQVFYGSGTLTTSVSLDDSVSHLVTAWPIINHDRSRYSGSLYVNGNLCAQSSDVWQGNPLSCSIPPVSQPTCQYGGTYPNCNPPPTCQYGGTYPNCNPPPITTYQSFDFQLRIEPSYQSVKPGGTATFGVTVALTSGNPQTVYLSVSSSGGSPASYIRDSSGTPTFTTALVVSTSQYTQAGTYTFTITGSSEGITHNAQATLDVSTPTIPFDFTLIVEPSYKSVNAGEKADFTVSLSLTGNPQTVYLDVSGGTYPAVYLEQSSGVPPFTTHLIINTSQFPSSPQPQTYDFTITGTSGTITHRAQATLQIQPTSQPTCQYGGTYPNCNPPPTSPFDFGLTISNSLIYVKPGGIATYYVNVNRVSGIPVPVYLSVTAWDSGAPRTTLDTSFGTPSFDTQITISTSPNTLPGGYTYTLYASGGGIRHNIGFTLNVEYSQTTQQPSSAIVTADYWTDGNTVHASGIFTIYSIPSGTSIQWSVQIYDNGQLASGYGAGTGNCCNSDGNFAQGFNMALTLKQSWWSWLLPTRHFIQVVVVYAASNGQGGTAVSNQYTTYI